ncbi:Lsr2 family DNA-binding protein [Streptomyces sp. NPDC002788]
MKAGGHVATTVQAATSRHPPRARRLGPASAPRRALAAIRTWARANGYQVADKGDPAKAVLDAYDAAHRTNDLADAS